MKTMPNLREEPCLTFVNVHKTSPESCDVQAFRRVDEAIQN